MTVIKDFEKFIASEDILQNARKNKNYCLVLTEYDAILYLGFVEDSGMQSSKLKTCFSAGLVFIENKQPKEFDHKAAKEILDRIFGNDTTLLWEHAPQNKSGILASMHTYYLFVSLPYGLKPTVLDNADRLELIKNFYFFYN